MVGKYTGGSLGLASQRFNVRSCLKGMRWRRIKQDTQCFRPPHTQLPTLLPVYMCPHFHAPHRKEERKKEKWICGTQLNSDKLASRTQFKGWCGRLNQTTAIPSGQQWTGRTPYYKDTAISLCKDWYLENKHGSVFIRVKAWLINL